MALWSYLACKWILLHSLDRRKEALVSNFPILGLQMHPLWRTGTLGEEPSQSLVEYCHCHPPRAEMGTSPTLPHPVQLCSKDFISRFVH